MWLDSAQIVIVLFILNSGLSSVSGGCEQSTSVGCTTEYYEYDTVNITEPWSRPCGTMLTSVTTKRQQQRHSVHRTLKKVQLKMRIARNSFKDLRKETQETYQNIKGMQKDAKYKFNWLPKDSLMWYCKKVMCLEKEKKPQRLLPYLYDNLQRFAITFHELQKFRLNTSAKDNMHVYRDWMIDVTFNQILQMLCEVENAMYNLQIDLPPPNNSSIITPKFWSKESDITQMLIQDWGVLKMYDNFLKQWSLGMNNALNPTLSNTCKTRSFIERLTKNPKKFCILMKKLLKMKKRTKGLIVKQ